MFNPRIPGRRVIAASACAALFAVAAPVAVPTTTPSPFAAPSAHAAEKSEKTSEDDAPSRPAPTTDVGREIEARMDEATETIADEGGLIGMAFLDRETGELICNDQCLDSFALASLSKVFIAEVVGYTNYESPGRRGKIERGEGDMPVEGNADAMLRDDMVRYSDNEATNALWSRYGGTAIVDNVTERYGLSDATIPNPDWGSTKSSAADMVTFFDGVLSGEGDLSEVETRYLVQLMYSLPRYSYGNADQNIGLRAALPDEFVGVKGGWYDPKIRTSAGFFGEDDRYVMAVLSRDVSPEEFTDAIAHVFPEGGTAVEERGDEAIRQATAVNVAAAADDGSSAPWMLALLAAAAAGFGVGWMMRRTAN
ncbi:serine hydrolase [Corynebacterium sp. NPDC060344]|uniref:serine hydrolase n=1 Tax=Corynebacterium sp. NPDC060344 TaxID=3347101 RepID=UPI00365B1149